MRDQLIQYVRLLFAGTPDSYDMQQEILQNTLDRYDDLIAQGKAPEAAYRLAISGIGDINEIVGNVQTQPSSAPAPVREQQEDPQDISKRKLMQDRAGKGRQIYMGHCDPGHLSRHQLLEWCLVHHLADLPHYGRCAGPCEGHH